MTFGIQIASRLDGAQSNAAEFISAVVSPAVSGLQEGQSVSDMTGYATMIATGNFSSTEGTISSAVVSFTGVASAAEAVAPGVSVGYSVLVTDSVGNTRDFNAGVITTTYIAPVAAGGLADQNLTLNAAMTPLDFSTDFTGNGITYALAPSSSALPAGLSLSSAGVLSGTPTEVFASASIVVRGTNPDGASDDSAISLSVAAGPAELVSVSAGTLSSTTLPLTLDVTDTVDVDYVVGDFQPAGNGATLINQNFVSGASASENVLLNSLAADATWALSGGGGGASQADQALNAFGLFPGLQITSGGADWHRTQASGSVTASQQYTTQIWYQEGTSGRYRVVFRDISSGNETRIFGTVGGTPTITTVAGTASLVSDEEQDGYRCLTISWTPNFTGSLLLGFGPDSGTSGQTVIVLGAQLELGATGTSYIATSGTAATRPAAIASGTLNAASDGVTNVTLPTGLDGNYHVIATTSDNTAVVSDGPFAVNTLATPPELTNLTSNGQVNGDLSMNGTVNEPANLDWVLTLSATKPDRLQVAAGQDHTGAAAIDSGTVVVAATGPIQTPLVEGLTTGTDYYFHANSHDGSGSRSTDVDTIGPLSLDTTDPGLSAAGFSNVAATTADGAITSNEGDGTVFGGVWLDGAPPDNVALQSGSGAAYHASAAAQAGVNAFSATGLAPNTGYRWYFLQIDAETNESQVVSSALFTTAAGSTPVTFVQPRAGSYADVFQGSTTSHTQTVDMGAGGDVVLAVFGNMFSGSYAASEITNVDVGGVSVPVVAGDVAYQNGNSGRSAATLVRLTGVPAGSQTVTITTSASHNSLFSVYPWVLADAGAINTRSEGVGSAGNPAIVGNVNTVTGGAVFACGQLEGAGELAETGISSGGSTGGAGDFFGSEVFSDQVGTGQSPRPITFQPNRFVDGSDRVCVAVMSVDPAA